MKGLFRPTVSQSTCRFDFRKWGGRIFLFRYFSAILIATLFLCSCGPSGGSRDMFKGGVGKGAGEFEHPQGIAVDPEGNVYVADTNNHRIQNFSSNGAFIKAFGKLGTGNGQFKEPNAVALDHEGNVYVTDTWNQRIQKFNSNGTFLLSWNGPAPGFYGPRGVAIGDDNTVYVVDTGNSKVVKYTPTGQMITQWGKRGSDDGEMLEPTGITVTRTTVFVADTDNGRIQVFDTDGKFIKKWTVKEWQKKGWQFPDLAYDQRSGRLYATSTLTHEVLIYNANGNFQEAVALTAPHEVKAPTGIAISQSGRILVLDTYGPRVVELKTP